MKTLGVFTAKHTASSHKKGHYQPYKRQEKVATYPRPQQSKPIPQGGEIQNGDRQDPPNQPLYQLNRSLNRFRQQKRCYDATLSRQEVSMMRHLANSHYIPQSPPTQ